VSAEEPTVVFVEEVLNSEDPELRQLVAAGLAPLPLPELLALQVDLAGDEHEDTQDTARASLKELEPRIVASVITEGKNEDVLRYFSVERSHPVILEAILTLREVPREVLDELASRLEPDMQELLLLRQDAIVEQPGILDSLASNPDLSSYAKRRIAEYRQHLLPREHQAPVVEEEAQADTDEDAEDAEVEQILEEFKEVEEMTAEEEWEEILRASEIKVRTLPVGIRMKLARGATAMLRGILVRDQNPQVALAVLKFSAIKESEIERIALSRVVVDEVLGHIANTKNWIRKYKILHAICQNPRTPINVGLRLLPRVGVRDMLMLSRNRNVAEPIRRRALRLYRIKVER